MQRLPYLEDNGTMKSRGLSVKSKKALQELVGESAGTEIAELISQMAGEIEALRRNTQSNLGVPIQPIQSDNNFSPNTDQTV